MVKILSHLIIFVAGFFVIELLKQKNKIKKQRVFCLEKRSLYIAIEI